MKPASPARPSDASPVARAAAGERTIFGHPVGLVYLFCTEAWERFSFSGMQALLVLYMVDELLQPGHIEKVAGFSVFRAAIEWVYGPLAAQPLSSVVFGLYTSLVFLMPVFGGMLGDRIFGQHRMVMTGALFMAAGHLLMAFEPSFLLALVLLILGAGCLKGNISTQVGSLYAANDRRRANGFQIFSAGINLGVIAAPFVCGTLGEVYGWHYGFAAAGIGMMIGLAVYIAGRRYLPPDHIAGALPVGGPTPGRGPATSAGAAGVPMLAALALVFVLVTCFLTSAGQLGNVYSLWIKAHVDRGAFGLTIPVTWFQSLTSLFGVAGTPFLLGIWRRQSARGIEPALLTKMAIGLCFAATGLALLGLLSVLSQHRQIPWLLLLPTHLLITIAYLYVWPVGLALFSAVAPDGRRAMFIGLFFLSSFVASNLVGWLGSLYSTTTPALFWFIHAAIPAVGALLVPLVQRPLRGVLATATA